MPAGVSCGENAADNRAALVPWCLGALQPVCLSAFMPEEYGSNKCQVTVALDASYSVLLLDFNLAISHTLKHCPSRPLYLLLNIDIPQPP